MITKQVSIFLENKSGRLNEVINILGEAKINISAFTIADTSDFGILRLIVSNPEKTIDILKQNQFSAQTTDVVLVKTANEPGALVNLIGLLNSEGIFIEYMYAFSMNKNEAVTVIRPVDIVKCMDILQNHENSLNLTNEL
ncbi:MAG: acetolactate synthase [Draconibacterium sp.]|nr:acetolactate synthase [Draconibacterium sp.]